MPFNTRVMCESRRLFPYCACTVTTTDDRATRNTVGPAKNCIELVLVCRERRNCGKYKARPLPNGMAGQTRKKLGQSITTEDFLERTRAIASSAQNGQAMTLTTSLVFCQDSAQEEGVLVVRLPTTNSSIALWPSGEDLQS
jgi:hypothetical protein